MKAKKPLTDRAIAALKPAPAGKRVIIWDAIVPSFGVRVSDTGKRTYVLVIRYPGDRYPTPRAIAAVGAITLADARAKAQAWHALVDRGVDPKVHEATRRADTFMSVAENYLAREGKKLRSLDERRATLERLIYPKLGARQIDDIRRSDVVALLDKIEDERGPVMADRALALVRKIFNWHASRSDTFESPIVKGMTRSEPRPRERILSDAELKAVWLAIEARPSPFGRLVQFLLLTAARRTEASATTWDELSDTDWIVPAARYKTDKELIVPLSGKARERLDGLPRVGPYVFTTNGRTSISGYSKFKAALDAASGTRGWTLHDLRRTARTLMSRAGVSPDIAERCLGHVIGGVRGVYDRFEYIEQKRAAFERLAAEIARIVAGVTEFS